MDSDDEVNELLASIDTNQTYEYSMNSVTMDEPKQEHLECLKIQFGHSEFRPMQWKIIRSIIEEKLDQCVIMATGYGKSLCFQYPSIFLNGMTIVISPLISLMEDQVLSLSIGNIPACFLGSAQKDKNIEDNIINGHYRIVYMSPEFLSQCWPLINQIRNKLNLIAIDEAHCVSQWGHDFRPMYRNLGCIREMLPEIPILAVTATATDRVRRDICATLKLKNPQILCTGFDRSNLEFFVRPKQSIWDDLRPIVQSNRQGSIIIYCLTRKTTEKIAEMLKIHQIECEPYHAGITLGKRKQILEDFVRDKLTIIVATIAFGMGIDKPDVRYVIHYGASKDIESYYQEVGRAGRDGAPAKCIMFFASNDFVMHSQLRQLSNYSDVMQNNLSVLSMHMQSFVYSKECRRLKILQYFEGPKAKCTPRSNCCDNCHRGPESDRLSSDIYQDIDENGYCDYTNDGKLLYEVLELFNGFSGLTKPIDVLRGSNNRSIMNYHNHRLHGAGKFKSAEYWNALAEQFKTEGFIVMQKGTQGKFSFVQTVQLSDKARKWYKSNTPLKLQPNIMMVKFLKKKHVKPLFDLNKPISQSATTTTTTSSSSSSSLSSKLLQLPEWKPTKAEQLRKCLLALRTELASRFNIMPYMIMSYSALEQLAQLQPLNLDELRQGKIDGMAEAKIQKFGAEIIACIMKFKNLLNNDRREMQQLLDEYPMPNVKVTEAKLRVMYHIEQKRPVKEISEELGILTSTVTDYTAQLIKCGYPIFIGELKELFGIDSSRFNEIAQKIPQEDMLNVRLATIKKDLPESISYSDIRLVLAYHQVRHHLKSFNISFCDPDDSTNSSQLNAVGESKNSTQHNQDIVDDDEIEGILKNAPERSPQHITQSCIDDFESDDDDLLLSLIDCDLPARSSLNNEEKLNDLALSGPIDDLNKTVNDKHADADQIVIELSDEDDDIIRSVNLDDIPVQNTEKKPHQLMGHTSKKRILYISDDDDDDDNDNNKKTVSCSPAKRILPPWMSQLPQQQPELKKSPARGGVKKRNIF